MQQGPQELQYFQQYLAQYLYDLQNGLYAQADEIYGFAMTAAANLFKDGMYDPQIAATLGALMGSIEDIRSLFLSSPPDYAGCIQLLKNGAIGNEISSIQAFLLAQSPFSG
jgi:hypothetical protein